MSVGYDKEELKRNIGRNWIAFRISFAGVVCVLILLICLRLSGWIIVTTAICGFLCVNRFWLRIALLRCPYCGEKAYLGPNYSWFYTNKCLHCKREMW